MEKARRSKNIDVVDTETTAASSSSGPRRTHTQRPIRLDPVFLLFFSDVLKGRKRRRGNVGPATLIRFDPLATIFYDRRDLGKGGKVKAYRSTTTSSTSSREEKKDNPVCMRSEESGRAAGCVSEERRRNGEREPSQECVCFRYSQHNHVRGGGMGWKGGVEGGRSIDPRHPQHCSTRRMYATLPLRLLILFAARSKSLLPD